MQESLRAPRVVRIAVIQNKMVLPTTATVAQQVRTTWRHIKTRNARYFLVICSEMQCMRDYQLWSKRRDEVASTSCVYKSCGVRIKHLPQKILFLEYSSCYTLTSTLLAMPFAMCTPEKHPWTQFAESAEDGPTLQLLQQVAIINGNFESFLQRKSPVCCSFRDASTWWLSVRFWSETKTMETLCGTHQVCTQTITRVVYFCHDVITSCLSLHFEYGQHNWKITKESRSKRWWSKWGLTWRHKIISIF